MLEALNILLTNQNFPLLKEIISNSTFYKKIMNISIDTNNERIISIATTILGNILATEHKDLNIYQSECIRLLSVLSSPDNVVPPNDALHFLSLAISLNMINENEFFTAINIVFRNCCNQNKYGYSMAVITFNNYLASKLNYWNSFDDIVIKIFKNIINFLTVNLKAKEKDIIHPCFNLFKMILKSQSKELGSRFLTQTPVFLMLNTFVKNPLLDNDTLFSILSIIEEILIDFSGFINPSQISLKDLNEMIDVREKPDIKYICIKIYILLLSIANSDLLSVINKNFTTSTVLENIFKTLKDENENNNSLNKDLIILIFQFLEKIIEINPNIKKGSPLFRIIDNINSEFEIEKLLSKLIYDSKNILIAEKAEKIINVLKFILEKGTCNSLAVK